MPANYFLAAALALPLLGCVFIAVTRGHLINVGIANLILTAATTIMLLAAGILAQGETVRISLSGALLMGINFRLDALALFFVSLFSLAATAVAVYSVIYMRQFQSTSRFFVFSQLTLLGCLGVILAADLLTLFLFFELMTFASYVLVIHRESPEALNAGNLYLFLGVIGGLALLSGIIIVYFHTGATNFVPMGITGGPVIWAAICFLLGFGIKTGAMPLHIWMPRAYAVSPLPVNIISSALMIKTGAYGLLRVYSEILFPLSVGTDGILGWILLCLGLVSMLIGAFLALRQRDMLRTLAYSSISQIGYVLLGLGIAVFTHGNVGLGISGMLFHILNHSVFKATLFFVAGSILYMYGTLEYSRLGGLFKRQPLLSAVFVVAALGIMGMPGLNGYASKTFLHHGIVALEKYNPGWILWFGEKIFVVASALTICYFLKMFLLVFWQEPAEALPSHKLPGWFKLPLLAGAAAVIFIGLFPHLVVAKTIVPAMHALGASQSAVDYALKVNVWIWPDLMEMGKTLVVAGILWLLLVRTGADKLRLPAWLSMEALFYQPVAKGFMMLCLGSGVVIDRRVNQLYHGTGNASLGFCRYVGKVDSSINRMYLNTGDMSMDLCRYLGRVDGSLNSLYYRAGHISVDACAVLDTWDQALDSIYNSVARGSSRMCLNLDHLDRDLDKLYGDLGLVSTRAIHRLNSMEQGLYDTSQYKKPAATGWWNTLQDQLENPQWNLSNLNIESIFVAIALIVVVIILVVYGVK